MASPQLEKGYTRVANELLDAMCKLHLSGNQWKVFHAIIRKTYGWRKKRDWITATQIAKMTGMYRSHVSSALAVLAIRKVILREGRLIAVQKDYDLWQARIHNVTDTCNNVKLPKPVTDVTNTCTQSVPIPVHTKEKRHYTKESKAPSSFWELLTLCKLDEDLLTDTQRKGLWKVAQTLEKKRKPKHDDFERFGRWWYAADWRGKKGDAPRPIQVQAEWSKFEIWRKENTSKWREPKTLRES